MKYSIGDKVKIKNDLNLDERYRMSGASEFNYATESMVNMSGQIVEITNAAERGYYIKEDRKLWTWTDEMFEGNYNNSFPFSIIINKSFNNCNECHAVNKCKAFKELYNGETLCGLLDLINKL